jgi:hypothetical protein
MLAHFWQKVRTTFPAQFRKNKVRPSRVAPRRSAGVWKAGRGSRGLSIDSILVIGRQVETFDLVARRAVAEIVAAQQEAHTK